MEVDLEQEPGPYLGSPGIKEDLDLFDPRLHDFRPSLIGRCFEEGEEDVVVPYNRDEQSQYQVGKGLLRYRTQAIGGYPQPRLSASIPHSGS
jgi:hypothetical protein